MAGKPQFTKSGVQCLWKHAAGNYYARPRVNGKLKSKCLGTDDYNLAKRLLPAVLKELRSARNSAKAIPLGDAIIEEAATQHPEITLSTVAYYKQIAAALVKLGDSLDSNPLKKKIPQVTGDELRRFMRHYAKTTSISRYNGSLALLRRTYENAVEGNIISTNLAAKFLKRLKPKQAIREMPTKEVFAQIVESIIAQGKTHSKASAAAIELMAYTGMRIGEARLLKWGDIGEREITSKTFKNREKSERKIPIIPAARDFFNRLRDTGIPTGPNDKVMLVSSPRLALGGACKRLGIPHLTPHDCRHIFATRSLESGIDLLTLAGWLGHSDNGVTAAKYYGHLCNEHSLEMAAKVVV